MSFYSYVLNIYNNTDHETEKFERFFLENLFCLPNFPGINLISKLSFENYERNACRVNLVFLPNEDLFVKKYKDPMLFTFDNKALFFEESQIRLARKLAESTDNDHALVLCRNKKGGYYFVGIIDSSEKNINKAFSDYYFISITGYSHWSARCKNFELFDFENGNFCDYKKNDKDFNEQSKEAENYFKSCNFNVKPASLQELMNEINKQNHGTAFVVFKDKGKAKTEADRLCKAQRGFKPRKPLKYKDFLECIPQFTKVDGGFILDNNLTCYGYGCIFDGSVDESFKGSLANGARFNSTALYTYLLNEDSEAPICIGVVFSDDGGVRIAKT